MQEVIIDQSACLLLLVPQAMALMKKMEADGVCLPTEVSSHFEPGQPLDAVLSLRRSLLLLLFHFPCFYHYCTELHTTALLEHRNWQCQYRIV